MTKHDLKVEIAAIIGIQSNNLNHSVRLYDVSVAIRMKWASKLMTTREEVLAYNLLGLFDVNMPLLYGKVYKAFERLKNRSL